MKYFLTVIAAVVVISFAASGVAADSAGTKANGKLIHMVSFKFKPTATPAQIKEIEDAFRALKKKIPQIVSYEWGTNVSPEKHDKGFTHGFILSFKSAEDRDVYLGHPEHEVRRVGRRAGRRFCVIDFGQNGRLNSQPGRVTFLEHASQPIQERLLSRLDLSRAPRMEKTGAIDFGKLRTCPTTAAIQVAGANDRWSSHPSRLERPSVNQFAPFLAD
jgi:hypothetical protein